MKAWSTKTAGDVMKSPVLTIDGEAALSDAAAWMSDNRISGAPILDHTGRPVGVVSLFDIVSYLAGLETPAGGFYRYAYPRFAEGGEGWEKGWDEQEPDVLKNTPVSEIMTPEILTVDEDEPLPRVMRMMWRRHVHRVFVTRKGNLAGVISTMDVLGAVSAPAARKPERVRA